MSWRMVKEVRDRRMAKPTEWTPGEFVVMFLMADTCQGDARQAAISMGELETLIGKERTAIWRSIRSLQRKGALTRIIKGNQFSGASVYDVLPSECCADATSTAEERCTEATFTGGEHVAFDGEHVAFEGGACCTGATLPDTRDNYPDRKPMFASLTSAKENQAKVLHICVVCMAALDGWGDCTNPDCEASPRYQQTVSDDSSQGTG